jgi:3-deoxy-D-manno-octulosonic-acid transferase
MNRFVYNIILHTLVAPFLAAYYLPQVALGKKYRHSLQGKLGRLPADFIPESLPKPRVWFHAVSVGEVNALGPLVRAFKHLRPSASVIVSTGTETGQDRARDSIADADGFFYLPLDFPAFVNSVVTRIQPDLFVLMETELWPNLIHSIKSVGATIALANGRISDRSFPRYKRLRAFFLPTLDRMDLLLMASETDALRMKEMGAHPDKIRVTGNTKFDAALGEIPLQAEAAMREVFDVDDSVPIFVAGSTHPGENEMILDAYCRLAEKFPDLLLILVPRHVDKTPQILSAMRDRNMDAPFLRSSREVGDKRNGRKVVIVDCTGELFQIFSIASVVFIGGSLVPTGGQNILEPAAWGKMVLFGPSMEDFRDARDILVSAGSGREVRGVEDLVRQVAEILSNPEAAQRSGMKGREEILGHVGSARKNAELLAERLPTK